MNIEKLIVEVPGQSGFTNGAWIVGDNREVIVTGLAHRSDHIALVVGGRRVRVVLLIHGYWGHVTVAPALVALMGDPLVHLNPADEFLWWGTYPHEAFRSTADSDEFAVAGVTLRAIVTPGHTLDATCFVIDKAVSTDDTLFEGDPGATRWDYSDFGWIIASIRKCLFILPDNIIVNTDHDPSTTIGKEHPHLDE